MDKYINFTLKKYIQELSSGNSVPGGGSSSAVVGLNGVSLLLMVANFTLGNDKYKKHTRSINAAVSKLEDIQGKLEKLVTEDAVVYMKLMDVCKLHKKEKLKKTKINKALKLCASVPEEIAKLSEKAFNISAVLLSKGNINLVTDVACAILFLKTSFLAARYNVLVNIKYVDKETLKRKQNKMDRMSIAMNKKYDKLIKKIDDIVLK